MPAPPAPGPRRLIETPVLLSRPLDRYPGSTWCLLLQGPDGAITGGFYQGRRLDAAQAEALQLAHRWKVSDAISPRLR
jgi:hypothetical protein